jgi:hypothetical protein
VPVEDLGRYTVRFVEGRPPAPHAPALYRDGRRVTEAWSLSLDVTAPADEKGAGA